jgi:large subunit ribosomal protein L9
MRLILKEDVKDLGRVGDVVTVAEGYGRNYLLPRKLAVTATPGNMQDHQKRIKAAEERAAKEKLEAQGLLDQLRQTRLTLHHRSAEGTTRLHGSITSAEIAEKINAILSPARPLDRRSVELPEPIRTLGEHTVNVRLGKGMTAVLAVEVIDENAPPPAAAAPSRPAAEASAPAPTAAETPSQPVSEEPASESEPEAEEV